MHFPEPNPGKLALNRTVWTPALSGTWEQTPQGVNLPINFVVILTIAEAALKMKLWMVLERIGEF